MKINAALAAGLLLLGSCDSRPAGRLPIVPGSRVPKPAAPPPATAALEPQPQAAPALLHPLPPDTSQLGARRAVLRQAVLPADTSAPLIPRASRRPRHPVRLPRGQVGYHRYVGTLGSQPVVVELTVEQPAARQYSASLYASFYFEWGGQERRLRTLGNYTVNKPLFLIEKTSASVNTPDDIVTGTWRARQCLGPTLTGTWTDRRTRRTAPFILHENYVGAVRYELLDETVYGQDSCRISDDYYRRSYVQWVSLHLLGADTLRLAWRHLQCLTPRRRRRAMCWQLLDLDCGEAPPVTFGIIKDVFVSYNANGLLAITTNPSEDVGAAYPMDSPQEHVYDLATGKECTVAAWLLPARLPEFRQLLTTYLLADETGWDGPYGDPPAPFHLEEIPVLYPVSTGIAFRLGSFGQRHVSHLNDVTIPYATLAPYVRPGTPLARLVAARTRPGR